MQQLVSFWINTLILNDVINIKWLPIEKPIKYSLALTGVKANYDESVPNHLKLTQKVASTRNLRSSNKGILINANQQSKTSEKKREYGSRAIAPEKNCPPTHPNRNRGQFSSGGRIIRIPEIYLTNYSVDYLKHSISRKIISFQNQG